MPHFDCYYIVANTRDEFQNISDVSEEAYNDHPSMKSIRFLEDCMKATGYRATHFGGINELVVAYQEKKSFPNALFLNLSDGLHHWSRKAQSAILLEMLELPYVGSDPLALLTAGNKSYSKNLVRQLQDINLPKGELYYSANSVAVNFLPAVLKPNREGSSVGITQNNLCRTVEEIQQLLPEMLGKYKEVLLEEYIPGYEVTQFLIGNDKEYTLNEVILSSYKDIYLFDHFIFGAEEKSNRKRRQVLADSVLDADIVSRIKVCGPQIFRCLNMRDFARIDYRITEDGRLYFLEINGNPVISPTSEIGIVCEFYQLHMSDILRKLIESAEQRINRG